MADREVQRRLAAILAADVAGYTRLMEADTDGTVAAWQDAREDVIKPSVADHSGKIVKLTGDGFLVEFPTVQDAVNCAIAMQRGLVAAKLDFRMGVNLGDIVDDGEDIHGEGVNVAARLEGVAEPGGICISGMVYESIRNRIDAHFEDIGDQEVKNVSTPVRAYRISLDPPAPDSDIAAKFERPAIAVLPFDNMSGDPEQEYFADGLTEDIITGLSAWRQFPVIGRNSTFSYKGTSVKSQEVAGDLGARYILEGSVRKAGNRIRVTAQLLDGETGHHVWAERYDRELADVFDLQDEITLRIVNIIAPEMERAERERSSAKPPANMDAWDHYIRGIQYFNENKIETIPDARAAFERSLEIDPTYARAKTYLAYTYFRELLLESDVDRELTRKQLLRLAEEAVELDGNDAECHWILGHAWHWNSNNTFALNSLRQALEINPLHIPAQHTLGILLGLMGRYDEAIPYMERAIEFTPRDPRNPTFVTGLALIQLEAGMFQDAYNSARRAIDAGSRATSVNWILVSALGHLGEVEHANRVIKELGLSSERAIQLHNRYDEFRGLTDLSDLAMEGIRKTGIFDAASSDTAAVPTISDKPCIAVLPFDNLSGDADQEFFSDGITEDIITALSRLRWLSVIARNTTFTYKGQAVDVPAIAAELNVGYVLEGSVRKAGNRVRITAQLIDGGTGNHIWAERYDRELEDVFAVQDEITGTVSGTVQSELGLSEQSRAKAKPPESLDVWETYQRGNWHMNSRRSEDVTLARELFERAIQLDPNFAPSYSGLSLTYTWGSYLSELAPDIDAAFTAARKAVELDQYDHEGHIALGMAYYVDRDHDRAISEYELAVDLNHSAAYAHYQLARSLTMSGKAALSIPHAETAIRLSPKDGAIGPFTASFAAIYLFLEQHEDAVTWALKALRYPNISWPVHVVLISALGHLGRADDARRALDNLDQFRAGITIQMAGENLPVTDEGYRDHLFAGLRAAGMAES